MYHTDSIGPDHFSSSMGMSVTSDSPHSPVKQMSAPKETLNFMHVSVFVWGNKISAHIHAT